MTQFMDLCMRHRASMLFNSLRPRQNGRLFADDTFKRIFLNEIVWISIQISLKFVPKGPINNNPALVQIMAWRRPGDKPLSEPMMVISLTHICVTRPQWVKCHYRWNYYWGTHMRATALWKILDSVSQQRLRSSYFFNEIFHTALCQIIKSWRCTYTSLTLAIACSNNGL